MSEQPDYMPEVRRRFRAFQDKHGRNITPALSLVIGNRYREAVDKDPTGRQALHLLDDIKERLTPMKS